MRRLTYLFAPLLLLAVALLCPGSALSTEVESTWKASASHGEAASCVPQAVIVPSANALGFNELTSVSGASTNDIWAVGSYYTPTTGMLMPLLEHWDGNAWSLVPGPTVGNNNFNQLNDVFALSADDVWAVGTTGDSSSRNTFTQHWDGTRWTVVPSPNPGLPNYSHTLYSVSGAATNDVWAVGAYSGGALFLHWNGSTWVQVDIPGSSATYFALEAIAPNDVWAVGVAIGTHNDLPAILHWDGTRWNQVQAPGYGTLVAVEALASNDIWAVGYYRTTQEAVTLHWNGTQWQSVPTPSPGPGLPVRLFGVSGSASGDVWAVGMVGTMEAM